MFTGAFRRSLPMIGACSLLFGGVVATTSGAASATHITGIAVTPAEVFPAFDEDIFDYAIRCAAGVNNLDVVVDAPTATAITVDGVPATTGVSVPVSVSADDLFVVAVTDSGLTDEFNYRCLPDDFPTYTIEIPGTPGPGYYFTAFGLCFSSCPTSGGSFLTMLDTNGVPVWYKRTRLPVLDQKLRSDGNVTFIETPAGAGPPGYQINSLGGAFLDIIRTDGIPTDLHEIIELASGNDMLMSYVDRPGADLTVLGLSNNETAIDGYLQEIDASGTAIWEWRSQDHIAPEENVLLSTDLVHLNSIEEFPDGDLLISGRSVGVYRIDRTTGAVEWKLGGTTTPESLTLVNDPVGGPKRMHDARVLPDGSITIFDNQVSGSNARATNYVIDTVAVPPTATLIWEYEHFESVFSGFMGSARRQADGNTVMNWGGRAPMVEEVDINGNRQFVITGPGEQQYRVVKYPLATFDIADLRADAGGEFETDAPLSVSAVAGDQEATVSWTPPTAGLPVTGYTVTSTPGGLTCTTATTSCTVTGLAAGTSYTFFVNADNVHGTSLASLRTSAIVPGPTCNGLVVTVDLLAGQAPTPDNDVILGTAAGEIIDADAGDDTVCAGGGADTVYGRDGADTIFGEAGNDILVGSTGNDILNGGADDDILNGQDDDDTLNGDAGNDILYGLDGADTLNGGDDDDRLFGHAGNDTLNGDAGLDTLFGGTEDDTLNGGDEADVLYGHDGVDELNGGGDDDKLFGHAGVDTLNGDDGNDVLVGSTGNDVLNGGADDDILNGQDDDDTLNGDAGNDILYGLDGNDTLNGGDNDDRLFGHAGVDTLNGDAGDDLLVGGQDNDVLSGGAGVDTLRGNSGPDFLIGGTGNDILDGGSGSDILSGGADDDTLNGGIGNDILFGHAGNDTLNGGNNDDRLYGHAGVDTLNGDAGNDILVGSTGNDILNGGADDDILNGQDDDDTLNGDAGNDVLYGLDGADTLNGGDDDDRLFGHAGNDTLNGDAGLDTLFGGTEDDTLNGGDDADVLYGHDGVDELNGGGDDDRLYGHAGVDTLNGDAGNDILVGSTGNDILNGGADDDILNGQDDDDILNGDAGNDILHGLDGNDTLNGGDDDDRLRGWSGDDTLVGGLGADELGGGSGLNDSCDGSVDTDIDIHLGGCEITANIP